MTHVTGAGERGAPSTAESPNSALMPRGPADDSAAWTRESVYEVVWPVVFERLTRPLERSRGHYRCSQGIGFMEHDCHDDFLDAVEAVVADVLRHAGKVPFNDLPKWITPRIRPVVVDAHRVRRGQRGAQQRPRLPQWLADELKGDAWLAKLAVDILIWVGVPETAGGGLWPLNAWAERRAQALNDPRSDESAVAADVEAVLTAMRTRPEWYDKYVERPLGHKRLPVVAHPEAGTPLVAYTSDAEDAALEELAAQVVDALQARLARGDDPRTAVIEVVETCFTPDGTAPTSPAAEWRGERVAALLADDRAVERMVAALLGILRTT